MASLTRRYFFSASHRLHSDALTAEENARVFGKCNNPYGHGHNYFLRVTVEGPIDPRTGMVVPHGALDEYIRRTIVERLDHSNLNTDMPEFRELVPTTENLGIVIGRWLKAGWQSLSGAGGTRLAGIRLEETGANTIEITFSES